MTARLIPYEDIGFLDNAAASQPTTATALRLAYQEAPPGLRQVALRLAGREHRPAIAQTLYLQAWLRGAPAAEESALRAAITAAWASRAKGGPPLPPPVLNDPLEADLSIREANGILRLLSTPTEHQIWLAGLALRQEVTLMLGLVRMVASRHSADDRGYYPVPANTGVTGVYRGWTATELGLRPPRKGPDPVRATSSEMDVVMARLNAQAEAVCTEAADEAVNSLAERDYSEQ